MWFSFYVEDFDAGQIKRPHARPKLHETDRIELTLAAIEYEIVLRYLGRVQKKEFARRIERYHPEMGNDASLNEVAARLVVVRRRLPISWRTLQNRVSAKRV